MPEIDDLVRVQKRLQRLETQMKRLSIFAVLALLAAAGWLVCYAWPRDTFGKVALALGIVLGPFFLLIWLHGMAVPEE
jgi:hypothetical protein